MRQGSAWLGALRPGDWLILACGMAFIAALWLHRADSLEGRVIIRLDGRVFGQASLRVNRTISVPGPLGESRVQILNGKVRVLADPGPRQICVKQGWIPPGGAAVCLPNRVTVENAAAGYDSLNY
jgi:hypothetical protein